MIDRPMLTDAYVQRIYMDIRLKIQGRFLEKFRRVVRLDGKSHD
jgi:hypothetical protein